MTSNFEAQQMRNLMLNCENKTGLDILNYLSTLVGNVNEFWSDIASLVCCSRSTIFYKKLL